MNNFSFKKKELQVSLNAFAFFLAWPFLDILGNSIYFYIFIIILLYTKSVTGKYIQNSKANKLFALFFFFGAISSITHPILVNNPSIYNVFKSIIQLGYWCLIGSYFSSWFNRINIFLFSKWIFIGFVLNTLFFFLIKFKINLFIINIDFIQSRNGFIFNTICFSGLIFYYLYKTRSVKSFLFTIPFLNFIILSTDGRAGAIILLLMSLLIIPMIISKYHGLIKFSIISASLFLIIVSSDISKFYTLAGRIVPYIQNIAPRFSDLLIGARPGGLALDKSWLIRQLMVDKGIEINKKHPVLGIGLNNFTKYSAELKTLPNYFGLFNEYHLGNITYYNKKSSHNSYLSILAELGYIGLILFLVIIIPTVFWVIKRIWNTKNKSELDLLLVSFIGMLIHIYVITAFTGANTWVLIGLTIGLKNQHFLNEKRMSNYKN